MRTIKILEKYFRHFKRLKRARQYNINYTRSSEFEVPSSIDLNGKSFDLVFPSEIGVMNDFLSIFLDDDYYLEKINCSVSKVLDIGANIGFFSIAARNAFPEAIIHSYEPNNNLNQYLVPHSKQAEFTLFNEAVGFEAGSVSLEFIGETNQTRSHVDDTGTIPQVSFSQTIDRLGGGVDFAKIDCEGAEWELFQDFESWQKIGFIAMEYHLWQSENSHLDVTIILTKLGFKIIKHIPIDDYGLIYGLRQ